MKHPVVAENGDYNIVARNGDKLWTRLKKDMPRPILRIEFFLSSPRVDLCFGDLIAIHNLRIAAL